MHDNPRATEHEQQLARRDQEESVRYPGFHDPDEERRRSRGDGGGEEA